MNETRHPLLCIRNIVCSILGVLVVMTSLPYLVYSGYEKVVFHLIAGFVFFLRANLPAISTDAATWGPGLAASILTFVIAHCFLRSWASKQNRTWGLGMTQCLVLILPVLFIVSFLVPGVLLQLNSLGHATWFERHRNPRAEIINDLRNLWCVAIDAASKEPGGRFPATLDELIEEHQGPRIRTILRSNDANLPSEPIIYLGSRLTWESDGSLPLFVSSCYQDGGILVRQVMTLDGDSIQIRDEVTGTWVDRVMQTQVSAAGEPDKDDY